MNGADNAPAIGPYRVERELGSGGMGVVHLATSPTGRRVAVKVIHQRYAADLVFRSRFAREVSAARTVSGAFTAPVVDADTTGPTPWMATLFIPGLSLTDHVAAHGPLDADALTGLAAGLVEALRDIHRVGLIHRDLKPGNVLMTDDGPRVIDFGITRAVDAETLTETGAVIGTPPYMAPEQFRSPKKVGQAADVFALGAVLTFAATGRGPFDGENGYAVAWNVVHELPDLDGVPPALLDLVESCLAKEPDERPTPDELFAHLSDRPPRRVRREAAVAKARRRSAPSTIAAATAVLLLAAGGAWFAGPGFSDRTGPSDKHPTAASPSATSPTAARPAAAGPLREGRAALRPQGWALWENHDSMEGDAQAAECTWARTHIICALISGPTVAYDIRSGKVAWTRNSGRFEEVFLTDGSEGDLFLASHNESGSASQQSVLTVRDTATGGARWSTRPSLIGEAVLSHGLVVAAVRSSESGDAREIVAWDARTGAQRWTRSFPTMGVDDLAPVGDGLIVTGDHGGDGGFDLVSLDWATGRQRWTHSLGKDSPAYVGATRDHAVYSFTRRGTPLEVAVALVDPATGRTQRVALAEPTAGGVALDDTSLYIVRSDGRLRAFDAETGTVRWTVSTGGDASGIPTVSGQRVYVQTLTAEIDCRDAATGRELWRSAPRRDPDTSLTDRQPYFRRVVDKGIVYALSDRNSVFAIAPPGVPVAPAPASSGAKG